MSEIKNDPGGKKQILVSIVSSLTAIILLYISSTGASLKCSDSGDCEIKRKNIFSSSSDSFHWKDVKDIQYIAGGSENYNPYVSKKGAYSTNLLLELKNEKKIPIFVSGVAWTFGKLDRAKLHTAIESKKIENHLWAISFGGVTLVISFIFGMIGIFFILFQIITPITPELTEQELQKARSSNLIRFLILLTVSGSIWYFYIIYLTNTFAAGL